MVGVLDQKFCPGAKAWKANYEASKVYLGIDRILPGPVSVSLEWEFKNNDEEIEFFEFWENETSSGAKPFYVLTGLYGVRKYYLVSLDGSLSHSKRSLGASGKFELYRTRTLEENTAPVIEMQSFTVDMDSTSNFMHIKALDYDEIVYEVITAPSSGELVLMSGGVVYYTPTDGFSGTDTFVMRVTDELGITAEATMRVDVINWKLNEEFMLTMSEDGHLYIDYVHPESLDALIVQAVDELSSGDITHKGEYEIDLSTTTHIDAITKTADDQWLITPK